MTNDQLPEGYRHALVEMSDKEYAKYEKAAFNTTNGSVSSAIRSKLRLTERPPGIAQASAKPLGGAF